MLVLLLSLISTVQAFCGFYVSGADASLYNNATLVVMMRSGTTTVLSMQNSYQGPPEDFAMVVPVPTVLQKDNVKTLPPEIFARVDALAAPRLVEYWEQDPCEPLLNMQVATKSGGVRYREEMLLSDDKDYGVKVEAQFAVAEYDIVILSAKDSGGLDAWLRKENYKIPAGAETVLRGYVEAGTKFFVAKVDARRVSFRDGQAVLSPLRMHYDSADFSLPVRLGLLNSQGEQDLLVHVLAPGQRYEVANYENITIPTNIKVLDSVRAGFGDFYDSLFRRATAGKPRVVVTEYAWASGTCDPCPTQPLSDSELLTLGGDVIAGITPWDTVLTRLHYRYTRETLGEDLVFRAAAPITGGRGVPDPKGNLGEQGSVPSGSNQFQGRYIIMHPWEGPVACEQPVRGVWGGPSSRVSKTEVARSRMGTVPAKGSFVLEQALAEDRPELGLTRAPPTPPAPLVEEPTPTPAALDEEAMEEDKSAGPCATVDPVAGAWALLIAGALAWGRRRR